MGRVNFVPHNFTWTAHNIFYTEICLIINTSNYMVKDHTQAHSRGLEVSFSQPSWSQTFSLSGKWSLVVKWIDHFYSCWKCWQYSRMIDIYHYVNHSVLKWRQSFTAKIFNKFLNFSDFKQNLLWWTPQYNELYLILRFTITGCYCVVWWFPFFGL